MAKRARSGLILALMMTLGAGGPGGIPAQDKPPSFTPESSLDRLFALQDTIRDIHPAFETLYPVAIVSDGRFHIYEPDMGRRAYRLALEAPVRTPLPAAVRSAMPIDAWGNRMACLVTPDIFGERTGYAVIFHEFVHCYEWETCELRLKRSLGVYRRSMERKDFMWELLYPFPYTDPDFARDYADMLSALESGDVGRVDSIRRALKERLSPVNWEYMTWQEWKEGAARFLENEIKARLNIPPNRGGADPPFTRVSFYVGGELLIRRLDASEPGLSKDLEALYHRIAD